MNGDGKDQAADPTRADGQADDPAEAESPVGEPTQAESPAGERQVPFFCPYCGEEELRPAAADPGAWECRACARGFRLRFTGLVSSGAGVAP